MYKNYEDSKQASFLKQTVTVSLEKWSSRSLVDLFINMGKEATGTMLNILKYFNKAIDINEEIKSKIHLLI